jgi:hypothetical protein
MLLLVRCGEEGCGLRVKDRWLAPGRSGWMLCGKDGASARCVFRSHSLWFPIVLRIGAGSTSRRGF